MTSYENYITRDTAGGASIANFPGAVLEIDEPDVFALDILDAPNLESIHLKRLKALKRPHLVLSNLPKLTRVALPSGHPGAIVHFNCEQQPEPFFIAGAISEFDGAWESVQTRFEASPQRQHWSRLVFCTPEHGIDEPSGQGLVIVTGRMPVDTDQLTLETGNDWLIANTPGLRHVQINTSGKVVLQEVPNLRTANSSGHGLVLDVHDAPSLKRVSGVGDRFALHQKQSPKELTIAERWQHARIHSQTLETLNFVNGTSVSLHHCNALTKIHLGFDTDVQCFGALPTPLMNKARFFFDESSLNTCMNRFKNGEGAQLAGILSVLANAHEREQVVLSLQKIRELCDLGVAPELIWQTRRELAARHRDNRGKNKGAKRPFNEAAVAKADLYWHWKFPEDLAPQGWEADLSIWDHCQSSVQIAADYTDIIALTCNDEVAFATLLRMATASQEESTLFRLAIRCMKEYLSGSQDFLLEHNRSQRQDPTLRIVRLLIGSRASHEDKRTVIGFLCDILPLETLVKSVPPIVHLSPGLFRSQLMSLARKPDGWFAARIGRLPFFGQDDKVSKYRQRLMQIALAPCTREDEEEEAIEADINYPLFQGEA